MISISTVSLLRVNLLSMPIGFRQEEIPLAVSKNKICLDDMAWNTLIPYHNWQNTCLLW